MEYQIREMTVDDISIIVFQEEEAFGTSLGYDILYTELMLNPFAFYFVLEINNQVEGALGMWIEGPTAQIVNVYVAKDYRGLGFGDLLLRFVIDLCKLSNVEVLSLEVRPSNKKAINLYKKYEFTESYIREGYYSDGEDAIVMILNFEVEK